MRVILIRMKKDDTLVFKVPEDNVRHFIERAYISIDTGRPFNVPSYSDHSVGMMINPHYIISVTEVVPAKV